MITSSNPFAGSGMLIHVHGVLLLPTMPVSELSQESLTLTCSESWCASVRLCAAVKFRHRRQRAQLETFPFLLRLWAHSVPTSVTGRKALSSPRRTAHCGTLTLCRSGTFGGRWELWTAFCTCSGTRSQPGSYTRGGSIAVVSKLLGHGSFSTTLNIYAHVLTEHLEQFERQRAPILGSYWALNG